MAKHVPKSAGLAILAVITALVLWDASRTSDALDELGRDAHASRYEACHDKSHEPASRSTKIAGSDAT
ncbi:MAG TPA: hypothetical protein DCX71_02830 [Erythrobacter sp.]|jgi:hypothetical protein|nr:hypothetical protein [Sphingomonadaceae bacterium]HAW35019.1 hypothetical protein [Erythrobacter sp.]|tara:strand:+ start:346 stop:549 length:204 start_codon:yes stop_codon:yes gene_type:complete